MFLVHSFVCFSVCVCNFSKSFWTQKVPIFEKCDLAEVCDIQLLSNYQENDIQLSSSTSVTCFSLCALVCCSLAFLYLAIMSRLIGRGL